MVELSITAILICIILIILVNKLSNYILGNIMRSLDSQHSVTEHSYNKYWIKSHIVIGIEYLAYCCLTSTITMLIVECILH